MKASKRLIKAIIILIVSVVLCAGVCLAWFAVNGDVDANGLNSNIKSTNIKSFTVTAYSLTNKQSVTSDGETVTTYTLGPVVSGKKVNMEPYGNLEGKETALLLEFKYEFIEQMGKHYGIYAQLAKTIINDVANTNNSKVIVNGDKTSEDDYDFLCDLSSATDFYGAAVDGTKVTQTETIGEDANSKVNLNGGAATDETVNTELTFYCIIDYVEESLWQLYSDAVDLGGAIWSQMRFDNDIDFYIQEF